MKEQVNIGNIGWYLLQAQEGNLDVQAMDALCAFLEQHPELVPETEQGLTHEMDAKPNSDGKFSHLKKEDFGLDAFDTLAVSVLEGERDANDLHEITSSRSDLQQQWRAFQHTVLKSETVSFPSKSKLYKNRVQILWLRYAAAACFVAMLAGWVWNNFSSRSPETQQAVNVDQTPAIKNPVPAQNESLQAPKLNKLPQKNTAPIIPSQGMEPAQNRISDQNTIQTQLAEIEKISTRNSILLPSVLAEITRIEWNTESLPAIASEQFTEFASDKKPNKLAGLLRSVFSGRNKASSTDWVDALASAGNQSLEQISKGRIEFSHQPENDKGPDTYLKIGNFSISRSMASN
jgi:hypothetical protein